MGLFAGQEVTRSQEIPLAGATVMMCVMGRHPTTTVNTIWQILLSRQRGMIQNTDQLLYNPGHTFTQKLFAATWET